jgi:ribonuclease HI
MSLYRLEFDGVSRGNPGHAGAAAFLFETKDRYKDCVWFDSEYLGNKKTNNQAEYSALILGLKECVERQVPNLEICGDSELVIRQLKGEYHVKHKKLVPLHQKAIQLISSLTCTPKYTWIPREENKNCDRIANLVVDRELGIEEEEDEDEEDEIEERCENFGFTKDELNLLLSYGMKPWENYSECFEFVEAYKSGETDEDGEPLWAQHLGTSSMWDD